jgi:hypothetical protein
MGIFQFCHTIVVDIYSNRKIFPIPL